MAQPWHGRFGWYELMTTDPKAAEGFYTKVVGWGTQPFPGMETPYTMWTTGEQTVGGLMQLPAGGEGGRGPAPLDALRRGRGRRRDDGAGAVARRRPEVGPREIPSAGRFAVLSDPQGAVFAILQPGDPAPTGPRACPRRSRSRGASSPRPTARGRRPSTRPSSGGRGRMRTTWASPSGVYQEFGRPGLPLGGIYTKPADMPFPPHWLIYAKVPDIEARSPR